MNVDTMLEGARDAMTVRRVYGEPIERDGTLIIPAAKVGGGGGGGSDNQGNGGGGFGVSARPAGAYIVRGGEVSWQPAIDMNLVIVGGQVVAIVMFLALRAIFGRR